MDSTLSVVLMTAFGGVTLAVEALKHGAVDFVLKPWQNEKLAATISAAVALTRARRETADLKVRNSALAIESGAARRDRRQCSRAGAYSGYRRPRRAVGRQYPDPRRKRHG